MLTTSCVCAPVPSKDDYLGRDLGGWQLRGEEVAIAAKKAELDLLLSSR